MVITFDQEDHPDSVPHLVRYPLVVSLIVGTTRLTKVLMDGGSSLNILYTSTLDKMGIPHCNLRPSKVPFYEIMLGKEVVPLGCIRLNITFSQPDNIRNEPLTFEVVDFPSVYHALLDRPCFTKYMAIPNYTYLKLKMPSSKGVITVEGSFEQAYYYEQDCVAQAAILVTPYDPDHSSCDAKRALAKEAAKAVVALDRLSISKTDKTPGCNGGSAGPSI
jgi:hypothetical protein